MTSDVLDQSFEKTYFIGHIIPHLLFALAMQSIPAVIYTISSSLRSLTTRLLCEEFNLYRFFSLTTQCWFRISSLKRR
jgi:hypothetical protein